MKGKYNDFAKASFEYILAAGVLGLMPFFAEYKSPLMPTIILAMLLATIDLAAREVYYKNRKSIKVEEKSSETN